MASPGVLRLHDGDRLDLRIGPAHKSLDGAELRMLAYNGSVPGVSLHVDGVPDETQAPIPVGGTFAHQLRFPDAGFYWYHPHRFA